MTKTKANNRIHRTAKAAGDACRYVLIIRPTMEINIAGYSSIFSKLNLVDYFCGRKGVGHE